MPLDVALSASLFIGSPSLVHAAAHARLLSDSFFQAIFGDFIQEEASPKTVPPSLNHPESCSLSIWFATLLQATSLVCDGIEQFDDIVGGRAVLLVEPRVDEIDTI